MRSLTLLLPVVALCSALVRSRPQALREDFLERRVEAEDIDYTESLWMTLAALTKADQEIADHTRSSILGVDTSLHHSTNLFQNERNGYTPWPGYPKRPRPGHPSSPDPDFPCENPCDPPCQCLSKSTIWELISQGNETKRLADTIGKESNLAKLLDGTEKNFTLFAMTGRALDRLQGRHQLLSTTEMLYYHVVLGSYSIKELQGFEHQTLPTALNVTVSGKAKGEKKDKNKDKDKDKDGKDKDKNQGKELPQRLRVDMVRHSVLLNGETSIVTGDIIAKNGIIHYIDVPLNPPPTTKAILSIIPEQFSTFALALSHTGLDSHLNATQRTTGTTFAPTNEAFRALGPRVNAFLFSPQGEECLRYLLKYHLVLDKTIYSDVIYGEKGKVDECGVEVEGQEKIGLKGQGGNGGNYPVVHVVSPTLLDGYDVTVDILWRDSAVDFRVNGFWEPRTLDVLASDGVIHVLEQILIPPKIVNGKVKGKARGNDKVTVEMLREWMNLDARMEL
ncbi:hypothetical protein N7454_004015 [Penicillium verhagenii]|nr:hypothetical protein N7454_004015 [Penicillium verhagenii]